MNLYTQDQLVALARKAGLQPRSAKIAAAIALCEAPHFADGQAHADFDLVGDRELADDTWGPSYGAWQVRSLRADTGTGRTRDALQLPRPRFNAASMVEIRRTSGWQAWTTFTNGQYKAYLPEIYVPPENTHVVVSGDTLSGIAAQYPQVDSWEQLATLNGLNPPYLLTIGQLITLPHQP